MSKVSAASKAAAAKAEESDRLQLAKAIQNIASKQEAFVAAVHAAEEWKASAVRDLETSIGAKRAEYEELIRDKSGELRAVDEEVGHKRKRALIDVSNEVAEHKREAALKYLEPFGEVAVSKAELQALRDEVLKLKAATANAIKEAVDDANASATKKLNAALLQRDLEHKANVALLEAQNAQKDREIEVTRKSAEILQKEVAEQRILTKEVANAGRAAPITQSFAGRT